MSQGNPVALVTGGAVGIGRAISLRLARDGFAVAIAYHSRPADSVVDEIVSAGGTAIGVAVDVTSSSQIEAVVGTVVAQLGRLDVLVNNAGGLVARVPLGAMSDEHWRDVIDLNLTSVFACTRAAIPHLGEGGRIINISSLAALNGGGAGAGAYAAAKAGVIGLTYATAKEVGPSGVTVNAITPGYISDTPFHETFSSAEAQDAMVGATAVGRAGVPDDVAGVVSYLASADAGFVTGTVTDLNGGSYFR